MQHKSRERRMTMSRQGEPMLSAYFAAGLLLIPLLHEGILCRVLRLPGPKRWRGRGGGALLGRRAMLARRVGRAILWRGVRRSEHPRRRRRGGGPARHRCRVAGAGRGAVGCRRATARTRAGRVGPAPRHRSTSADAHLAANKQGRVHGQLSQPVQYAAACVVRGRRCRRARPRPPETSH